MTFQGILKTLVFPAGMACIALVAMQGLALAKGDKKSGADLARIHCGACHAVDKTSASPNPKSPAFRDLARRYPLENLEEALAEGIMVGHEGQEMPEFSFSPPQIDDLIAYLKQLSASR